MLFLRLLTAVLFVVLVVAFLLLVPNVLGGVRKYHDPEYGYGFKYSRDAYLDKHWYDDRPAPSPQYEGTLGGVALYPAEEEVVLIQVRRRLPETSRTLEQYKEFLLGDLETDFSEEKLGGLRAHQHRFGYHNIGEDGRSEFRSFTYTFAFSEDRVYFVDCIRLSRTGSSEPGPNCRQVLGSFYLD